MFERVGTAAIAVAAAASLLAGWLGRSSALVLSALLAFLTLDDAIGLHEQVPAWKLVYLPLLTVIAVLLWRLSSDSRFARSTLRIGLALLAFSLVGGEIAEWQVVRQGWGPSDLGYELKILVKDGSEVVGWIFVAAGLIAAAVEHLPASGQTSRRHSYRKGNGLSPPPRLLPGLRNRVLQIVALYAPGGDSVRPTLHRARGVRVGKGTWIGAGASADRSGLSAPRRDW